MSEDRKHCSHPSVKIQVELEEWMKQWQSLLEKFNRIKTVIDGKYGEIIHLVGYLDRESLLETDFSVKAPTHNVSQDIEEFNAEFIKFNKTIEVLEKRYQ